MAKNVLSLFIKTALFIVIMLAVVKMAYYEKLIDSLLALFDFQSAQRVTHFILGESDSAVWESLQLYLSLLINILISVPLVSIIITASNIIRLKMKPACAIEEFIFSVLRRLIKVFIFAFLFWGLFRCLTWHAFWPVGKIFSDIELVMFFIFNLTVTIICYCFIAKKITFKRSL